MKISKQKIKLAMKHHMLDYGRWAGELDKRSRADHYLQSLETYYPEAVEFWYETYPSVYPYEVRPEGEVWELCEKYYLPLIGRVARYLKLW